MSRDTLDNLLPLECYILFEWPLNPMVTYQSLSKTTFAFVLEELDKRNATKETK